MGKITNFNHCACKTHQIDPETMTTPVTTNVTNPEMREHDDISISVLVIIFFTRWVKTFTNDDGDFASGLFWNKVILLLFFSCLCDYRCRLHNIDNNNNIDKRQCLSLP